MKGSFILSKNQKCKSMIKTRLWKVKKLNNKARARRLLWHWRNSIWMQVWMSSSLIHIDPLASSIAKETKTKSSNYTSCSRSCQMMKMKKGNLNQHIKINITINSYKVHSLSKVSRNLRKFLKNVIKLSMTTLLSNFKMKTQLYNKMIKNPRNLW